MIYLNVRNLKKMTAIREIRFTGTLKDKWPDIKEFIFNDVLKDIDLSDIDRIAVHEITNDVVCNGRCYYPKKGSKKGCKLSISVNLKTMKNHKCFMLGLRYIVSGQKQIQNSNEIFLVLLCHELFHYLSDSRKIATIECNYIANTEWNANLFAIEQLIKWRAKE